MSTQFIGEGNIGSPPEYREFPNGNDDPRRLLRLNVYFDNPVPTKGGEFEITFEGRGEIRRNGRARAGRTIRLPECRPSGSNGPSGGGICKVCRMFMYSGLESPAMGAMGAMEGVASVVSRR